jgi:hypothetical protein
MMTATQRRTLYRELIRELRLYQVWSGAELRDRAEALRERNDALITARRKLDALIEDHTEELRARRRAVHHREEDKDHDRAASA